MPHNDQMTIWIQYDDKILRTKAVTEELQRLRRGDGEFHLVREEQGSDLFENIDLSEKLLQHCSGECRIVVTNCSKLQCLNV